MYSIEDRCVRVRVHAHAKSVYGITIHPEQEIFATAGEDTIVNIFSLPTFHGKESCNVSVNVV